jgi:hypothetical protein
MNKRTIMMAIQYNSNFDLTIPFSDVCVQFALATNTADSFTVPGGPTAKYAVRFGYTSTSNVFVRLNTAPTVPAPGTNDTERYNEFRPGADGSQRYVQGGDVIHFITPDASAYVGISLRQLPG